MFGKSLLFLLVLGLACLVSSAPAPTSNDLRALIETGAQGTAKRCQGQCYPAKKDLDTSPTTEAATAIDTVIGNPSVEATAQVKKRCINQQCSSDKREEHADLQVLPEPSIAPVVKKRCLSQCSPMKRKEEGEPVSEAQGEDFGVL